MPLLPCHVIISLLLLAASAAMAAVADEDPNSDSSLITSFFAAMKKPPPFPLPTGKVTAFTASGLGLPGDIPPNTVGKLTALAHLDLSNNSITGFPADFFGLGPTLVYLNLSSNSLSGELPANLANFHNLQILDLSQNALSGSIPATLTNCLSLFLIDLSRNNLSGDYFPVGLPNLTSVNLAGNAFSGRMPDLSASPVRSLNLSVNMFQGPIRLLSGYEVVDLSRNQFTGYIPATNLSSLRHLDLSENELSGGFRDIFASACSLRHLNLAYNRFALDKFPNVETFPDLEYLNLSRTHLFGKIPAFTVEKLRVLDLSSNNLTGEIPLSLQTQLKNLERFNFSFNNLTLCTDDLSAQALKSAFIGCNNNCPIAVDPVQFHSSGTKHKKIIKIIVAVAVLVFFFVLGLICALILRKRTKPFPKDEPPVSETDSTTWKNSVSVPVTLFHKPLLNLTFADLLTATSNFGPGSLISEGRSGPVYRAFLPGGLQVAVKLLVNASLTDDKIERLGRISHPNLVPIAGYCITDEQRLILYEYMEMGNLFNLLHDLPLGVDQAGEEGTATWKFRHAIALGTARALAFIHHGNLSHGNVKSSNIFLDTELKPRLLYTGLTDTGSSGDDVYAFGVVMFELLTGRRPESGVVEWARGLVRKNKGVEAVEVKIRRSAGGSEEEMGEMMRIAYLCTAESPEKRPVMQQVVGLLKDLAPS